MPAQTLMWLSRFQRRDSCSSIIRWWRQFKHPPNSFLPTCVCWTHFFEFAGCITSDSLSLQRSRWSVSLEMWFIWLGASSSLVWGKVAPVNKFKLHIHRGDQLKFACSTCLWCFNELLDAKKKKCNMNECWMCLVSVWFFFYWQACTKTASLLSLCNCSCCK